MFLLCDGDLRRQFRPATFCVGMAMKRKPVIQMKVGSTVVSWSYKIETLFVETFEGSDPKATALRAANDLDRTTNVVRMPPRRVIFGGRA